MKQNSISKSGILLECHGQRHDLAVFFNGTRAKILLPECINLKTKTKQTQNQTKTQKTPHTNKKKKQNCFVDVLFVI